MPFRLINEAIVRDVAAVAQNSSRRRSLYTFHDKNDDPVHRMLTVRMEDSYLRPHKHSDPDKVEVFIVLQGKLAVIGFADDGRVSEHVVIEAGKSPWGVEIPPGMWHTTIDLEPETAVYTVVEGPWDPKTHKHFAEWAPEESNREAGLALIGRIRQELMLY